MKEDSQEQEPGLYADSPATPGRHPAVFLDRDGVVIWAPRRYVHRLRDAIVIPGAATAIARLGRAGFKVVLVTNQPGVAHGHLTLEEVREVNDALAAKIAEAGGELHGAYFCPHGASDRCACRKPAPGMFMQAGADLDIDLSRSFIIGDRASDLRAGQAAGCSPVLVLTGWGAITALLGLKHLLREWKVIPSLGWAPTEILKESPSSPPRPDR